MPSRHPRVVVEQFVECQSEVNKSSLRYGLDRLALATLPATTPKDFDTQFRGTAAGEEKRDLATAAYRIEWARSSLASSGNCLGRHNVQGFPFRHLFVHRASDYEISCCHLRRRAPDTREPTCLHLFRSSSSLNSPLVHHGVELFSHLSSLGLALHFIAIDDSRAQSSIRASCIAASDGTVRLIFEWLQPIQTADSP